MFPKCSHCVALILLSLSATVASNERSFRVLKRLKFPYFRSTMVQELLNELAVLHINSDKAKLIDFLV